MNPSNVPTRCLRQVDGRQVPRGFERLLARGIGRHRAFGFSSCTVCGPTTTGRLTVVAVRTISESWARGVAHSPCRPAWPDIAAIACGKFTEDGTLTPSAPSPTISMPATTPFLLIRTYHSFSAAGPPFTVRAETPCASLHAAAPCACRRGRRWHQVLHCTTDRPGTW